MDAIQLLLDKTKQLHTELKDGTLMRGAVMAVERDITAENAETMFKGERSDGSRILPPYSPVTIANKKRKNHPYDRVTLRDTGSFQGNLYIEYDEDEFSIASSDWKDNPNSTNAAHNGVIPLSKYYGELIYGLQQKSIDYFAPIIAANALLRIRQILEL